MRLSAAPQLHLFAVAAIIGVVAVLTACRGPDRVRAENERLRFQVIELESRLATVERRNEELRLELQAAAAAPDAPPEEVLAATPHVTSISVGRLSFARDTTRDGQPDTLTLYLHPADGRGRFVQLVGEVTASAFLLRADADPVRVGSISLTPSQVRDAYRSGITGTHYTIEVPIQLPAGVAADEAILAQFTYADGRTGRTLRAERTIATER